MLPNSSWLTPSAPRPGVGHLAVVAVDARVAVERGAGDHCVAQLVQRRLGGGRQPGHAGIAGRVGDHVRHEDDRRQRMGGVDRDAREQRLDAVLLERQVVHHRHVGEELADAAADHGAAAAADVPGEAGARRERVVVVRRLLVVVPAQAEVEGHVAGQRSTCPRGRGSGAGPSTRWRSRSRPAGRRATSNWNGMGERIGRVVRRVAAELEGPGVEGRARVHVVPAVAAAGLEGVLAAQQAGHEVAERLVDDVAADHRGRAGAAGAGDVGWRARSAGRSRRDRGRRSRWPRRRR